jgi:hypothetical protein
MRGLSRSSQMLTRSAIVLCLGALGAIGRRRLRQYPRPHRRRERGRHERFYPRWERFDDRSGDRRLGQHQ